MAVANDLIAKVRDPESNRIVSNLKSDVGVNIFYHLTRKESIECSPDQRFQKPRYNPGNEVGRKTNLGTLFRSAITDYGNWIKMEEKGYLEPEIGKAELDLDRVIYARDWDDASSYTESYYSGGEIIGITTGGRGGIVQTSPIRWTGSEEYLELICGFNFYSIADDGKLRRDKFTARAGSPGFGSFGGKFVTNIEHQLTIRGSSNSLVRATSKAIDKLLRKDHFDGEVWELYEKCLRGIENEN